MRRVDHQPVRRTCLACQGREDALEHTAPAPTDEAIIQGLMRTVASRSVLPLQAVVDDVDNPADHTTIIYARQSARLRKEWLDPAHLPQRQQKQFGHRTPPMLSESHHTEPRKGS